MGVEFSLGQLRSLRTVAGAGLLQIGSAIVLSALAAIAFGLPLNQGVFWGFLAAMSSTAVVLKMVTERGETNSPHGRLIIGVLIVQDLAVVPMMVLTPVLGARGGGGSRGPVVGVHGGPVGALEARGGALHGPPFIDRSREQTGT